MERLAYELQKKVSNMKRLKPATQKKLIAKYSKDMGIPEQYFQFILNNDTESLMEEFNNMKNTPEAKKLNLDKLNLNNVNETNIQSTIKNITNMASQINNESESDSDDLSDEFEDPILSKVNKLREGDMRQNISKYIVENKLFSKTERMVVLLDPILKMLLNIDVGKMELKELNKLY
jgi:hypothetical protein